MIQVPAVRPNSVMKPVAVTVHVVALSRHDQDLRQGQTFATFILNIIADEEIDDHQVRLEADAIGLEEMKFFMWAPGGNSQVDDFSSCRIRLQTSF